MKIMTVVLLVPSLCGALTFEELSTRAYEHSLQKSDADAKRQSLIYEKEAAAAYEPAVLEGSTRRIRADDPINSGSEYSMMVGFSAKNPWMSEARNAQYDAAVLTLSGAAGLDRALMQIMLKREYLLGTLGKEANDVYAQKKETAQKAYAMAVKKEEAGRLSKMERVRYETELARAEQEYAASEVAYQRYQDRLREQTLLEGEIRVEDLSFGYLRSAEAGEHVRKSPVLALYELREEELTRQIETLRRSRVEMVGFGVGTTQEVMQKSLDLKVSVPIAFGERNEKKIAALMTQRSALAYQKALIRQKMEGAATQSLDRLDRLEKLITRSAEAEEEYRTLYKMAEKGLEGGVVGLFEYLETKNRFFQAKMDTIALKQEYVEEVARLEEKTGGIWE